MKQEIKELRTELERLEEELEDLKTHDPEDSTDERDQKWTQEHQGLFEELSSLQLAYEQGQLTWQRQLNVLTDSLLALKEQSRREARREKSFLRHIDAELIALAGRVQLRPQTEVSLGGDTLHESLSLYSVSSESAGQMTIAISKVRGLLRLLLERTIRGVIRVPHISVPSPLSGDLSNSNSSLFRKLLLNDEVLNCLSVTEREAVVYSLINAGERGADVRLEDLLSLSNQPEDSALSSISEEAPKDLLALTLEPNSPRRLGFSGLPQSEFDCSSISPCEGSSELPNNV